MAILVAPLACSLNITRSLLALEGNAGNTRHTDTSSRFYVSSLPFSASSDAIVPAVILFHDAGQVGIQHSSHHVGIPSQWRARFAHRVQIAAGFPHLESLHRLRCPC